MPSLKATLDAVKGLDTGAMAAARARQAQLTKPPGSLGRLEELAVRLAGIRGAPAPSIRDKAVIVMAADHGVAAEGVSAYPQSVTAQMVANFLAGGAAINVIARQVGARVVVVDMGVAAPLPPHPHLVSRRIAPGTGNMTRGPAMTRDAAVAAIETGIGVVESEIRWGLDIVATGDMGIGNTTASSAVCAVMTGEPVAGVTGSGTGVDGRQLAHKINIIERALAVNSPDRADPIDVLAKVGGYEIGGLAGVVLGAAAHRVPIVIDGFISGAAALIAAALSPGAKDYLVPAHCSVEPGHRVLLRHLGLEPLLDLEMRLGEGTGAAMGIWLCETAVRLLNEMATFREAGISERSAEA